MPIVALVTDDAVETGAELATVHEAGIDEKSFPQCDDVERGARIERDRLALREACETFSEPSPWSRQPYRVDARFRATTIVSHATGDCGGCGTEIIAVTFDGDERTASMLGSYGRFSAGPDSVRMVTIGGRRALRVDWSEASDWIAARPGTVHRRRQHRARPRRVLTMLGAWQRRSPRISFLNQRPVDVTLPAFVQLDVTETEPADGNSAAGNVTMKATVETSAVTLVPHLIGVGDTIKIDTRTLEYVERVERLNS